MIIRPYRFLTQPQRPAPLNHDYSQYVNSARLWSLPPTTYREAGSASLGGFTKTGTIDVAASSAGIGVKGDGSTGLYSRTVSVVPQAMWMAVQFVCNSVSALQKVAYALGSNAATTGAYCAISSGDSVSSNLVFALRAIDSSVAIGKTGPVPVVGNVYSCIAVFPSNLKADAYAYVNGVKYTTDFTGSSDITFVGANTLVNEAVGALKRGTTAVYSNDTILFTARGVGVLPEVLAQQISINPYSILDGYHSKLFTYSQAGVSVNVTPTGISSTSSLGNVSVSGKSNTSLTGLSSTSSLGNVTLSCKATVTLSGLSSTSALGLISVDIGGSVNVNLSGLSSTSTLGSLSIVGKANVSLTGLSSTSSLGTVTVSTGSGTNVNVNLIGLSSTSLLGNVFIWNNIDDSQTANWIAINDSQISSWTPVVK